MHTAGNIPSPFSCTNFSTSIMKSPLKDLQYYIVPLDSHYHTARMLLVHWCYTVEATNHIKISHYVFISKFTLLNIFYFIIIVPMNWCYYATEMLSAHWRYTVEATNHIKWCYSWNHKPYKDKSTFLYLWNHIIKYILTHYYCTARYKLL